MIYTIIFGLLLVLAVYFFSRIGRKKVKPFPKHWGDPPLRQTRDRRPLPGGYGTGSSTLAKWIQENLDRDKQADSKPD